MQHEPDVLVHQLGMTAALTDRVLADVTGHVFTTFLVMDQYSTIGTFTHGGNSRDINPKR